MTSRPSIVLAATFTIDPIVESLSLFMQETGLGLDVVVAPYGQVFQELLDPARDFSHNRDGVNVVFVRLEDWCRSPDGGIQDDVRDALTKNIDEFVSAVRSAASRISTPIVLCVSPQSSTHANDPILGPFLQALSDGIVSEVATLPSVRVLPMDWARDVDATAVHDLEGDRLGHVPYTSLFFAALGAKVARFVHALKTPPHKVLALDCDNTLWKGVVGEDGVLGIEITEEHAALQRFALEKKAAGMLLCLVSKNAEADVLDVFRERPDMQIHTDDIVATRINWQPKSESLRSLAQDLNLGLDSFVFVDDNPVECAEVESACPGVLSLCLPDRDFGRFLREVWPLDQLEVTGEDSKRTELYRQNLERDRYQRSATTLADFLAGLDLRIEIAPPRPDQLARVSQLTQRTNQFNFTTKRRSESEIAHLADEKKECRVVEVKDRFGDYGLVGVMIFGREGNDLVVDSLLLSCRVLGRGVEHTMVRELGTFAKGADLARVIAPFISTKKNLPAARFLESLDSAVSEAIEGQTRYVLSAERAASLVYAADQRPVDLPGDEGPKSQAVGASDPTRSARWNRIARELDTPEKILAAIDSKERRERALHGDFVAPRTETERRLATIWTDVLHLSRVGIRDDYFSLGGTSLSAVTIFARIERELGKRRPLAILVDCPTIETLAAHLDTPTTTHSLVVLYDGGDDEPPLFLVHDADGETLLYRNLAKYLGGRRTIYGIQPHGREDTPIVHTRIADMAAHYVSEIRKVRAHGPYLLGGLCAGAIVAFEMARQLEGSHEEARIVAAFDAADVDTPLKPHLEATRRLDRIRTALRDGSITASAGVMASKVRGYIAYKLASRARQTADRMAVMTLRFCLERGLPLPPWARNLPVRTVYGFAEAEYRPSHVVNEQIVLFRATSGEGADEPFTQLYADPMLGWGRRSAKGVQAIDVPGGHGSMLQEPHVAAMAELLLGYLSDSNGGPRPERPFGSLSIEDRNVTVGVVVIGRNEGERLQRCLESALVQAEHIVYVDSGSTDGSVDVARVLGVDIVELDLKTSFTAARARNFGFERLLSRVPDVEFVQFIDGDCELVEGWIAAARTHAEKNPNAAVICGRRRERHPDATVYNHLCDIEWDTPIGLAKACGGDFLVRRAAFEDVGGFTAALIAGEEPDLCFRLRERGWEIWRIDREMTVHDAAMTRFGQWWKRNVRSGHASAEALDRHGSSPKHPALKGVVSNVVWSLPAAWPFWPVLFWRVYRKKPDISYASFVVLGKIPHLQGQLTYWLNRARGGHSTIIEYK